VAAAVADVNGATVVRVHVEEGREPVGPALLDSLCGPGIVGAVLGAGRRPPEAAELGATALTVVRGADKPLVIVPRSLQVAPSAIHRVLLAIEDDRAATRALELGLAGFLDPGRVAVHLVHVVPPEQLPPILDRPTRDLAILAEELRARHLPQAVRAVVRVGPAGDHVASMCHLEVTDLVALAWHQDPAEGRAAVVKAVLRSSTVPVLLLPADGVGR
jgi:hypothetical protein